MRAASDIGCADDGAINNGIRNFYSPLHTCMVTQYQSAGPLPRFGHVPANMAIDAHASSEANIAYNISPYADDGVDPF